jgi:hypothetical protein
MLNPLRDQLISLFDEEQDARRIVYDARLDAANIDFGGSAANFWHSILTEAHKQARVQALVETVLVSYPNKQAELQQALQSYQQAAGRAGAARLRQSRPVPPLLPYLANRSIQEVSLEAVLNSLRPKNIRQMVCVIHGDENECHDKFLDRLEHNSLPRYLDLLPQRTSVKRYYLMWPEQCRQSNDLHERLGRNLATVVRNTPDATLEEINATLAQYPGPVMLHTHLLTEEWQAFGPAAAQAYLQFWQRWPPLAPGQFLLVCLCIKYQTKSHLGWLKRMLYGYINQGIANALERLAQAPPMQTNYTVLPRLEGIRQQDVENWVESHARQFCQEHDILAQVRAIFQRWEKETASSAMPMERLAEELTTLLQKYA